MRTAIIFVAVLATTGCLRKTEYKCSASTECGADGTCEGNGFCSFTDSTCTSGRRFGEFAGSTFAGQCVGDQQTGVDGGTDTQTDGQTGNCPSSYTVQSGSHRYRVITAAGNWNAQKTACAADGNNAYLAVPDDQTELTAILTAAAVARIWVGIEDAAGNDTFTTVGGTAFSSSSPLWDTASNEPDDSGYPGSGGGAANCVAAEMSTGKLSDEKCGQSYAAVCECEP